jgi:hypothetical protein
MGAWGYGPFDSDGALDFLDDLEAMNPEDVLPELRERLKAPVGVWDWQALYGCVGLVAARLGGYKGESTGTNLFVHLAAQDGDAEASLKLAVEPLGLDAHTGKVGLLTEDEARALAPLAVHAVDVLAASDYADGWDDPDKIRRNLERLRQLLEL